MSGKSSSEVVIACPLWASEVRDLRNEGGGGNSGLCMGFIRGNHINFSKSWADLNSRLDLVGSLGSHGATLPTLSGHSVYCITPSMGFETDLGNVSCSSMFPDSHQLLSKGRGVWVLY